MEELIPNFRDQQVQGAVKNLLTYSIVILLVPLGSMFLVKQFLQDIVGFSSNDSLTYSAVIAVVLVHVVLVLWIFSANKEEEKKQINKQD